jgi:hypothetical protein
VLGYAVCGSVANSQLVAIACEDATLHILHTDTGMTFVILFCAPWVLHDKRVFLLLCEWI